MKLPPDPYAALPTAARVKLQAYVPEADKDQLMVVIPNRDLYTLLINHALKRTVAFIKSNQLSYSNPGDAERLLAYIINGVDTTSNGLHKHTTACITGDTVPCDVTRKSTRIRATSKSSKD